MLDIGRRPPGRAKNHEAKSSMMPLRLVAEKVGLADVHEASSRG